MSEVVLSWDYLRLLDMAAAPSLEELEGWAYSLLCHAGMSGHVAPLPSQVLASLVRANLIVVYDVAPSLADGWYYIRGVYIDPDTPAFEIEEVIAHELSHWWLTYVGVRRSHQDAVVDQFQLCWRIARYGVYQLTSRERGGFAGGLQALVDTYKDTATPQDILTRAVMICRVGVIVFDDSGMRRLVVGGGLHEFNLVMDEGGEAFAVSLASSGDDIVPLHAQGLDSADLVAVPFFARERRWVALVVTPPTEETHLLGW